MLQDEFTDLKKKILFQLLNYWRLREAWQVRRKLSQYKQKNKK